MFDGIILLVLLLVLGIPAGCALLAIAASVLKDSFDIDVFKLPHKKHNDE